MLLGGVLGLAVVVLFYDQIVAPIPGYFKVFFILLPVMAGAVLGRIYAGIWANKKLRGLTEMLYVHGEAERFLEVFSPLVKNAPKHTIAYVDGRNKLSYAYMALGRFEEAEAQVADLKPEELKNHALGGVAMTCNQHLHVLLLQEKTEEARQKLEELRNIAEVATARAPALGKNTWECVRLYENWLAILEGQDADAEYIREEISLAKNRIHKSEMQLLLARAMDNAEDGAQAQELRLEAMTTGHGLWAESEARRLLQT